MTPGWPAPEVACRPATDAEIPRGARTVARAAERAGWTVVATYARGTRPTGTNHKPGKVVDSLCLRMRRPGDRVIACWVDGKFDCAIVHLVVGTLGLATVNATQLRKVLAGGAS